MKALLVPVALCAPLLGGCTNPVREDMEAAARKAAEPLAPVAKFVPDLGFCQSAARQAVPESFDPQTRQRMYADSVRQCAVLYALNDNGLRVADLGGGTVSY